MLFNSSRVCIFLQREMWSSVVSVTLKLLRSRRFVLRSSYRGSMYSNPFDLNHWH